MVRIFGEIPSQPFPTVYVQDYFRFPNCDKLEKFLVEDPDLQAFPHHVLMQAAQNFGNYELSHKDLLERVKTFINFHFQGETFSEEVLRVHINALLDVLIRHSLGRSCL